MYATVRHYRLRDPFAVEVLAKTHRDFAPLLTRAPGFVAYYTVDTDDGVLSISLFETQSQAEQSNWLAADFVKENLAELIKKPPEILAGEAAVFLPEPGDRPTGATGRR